jgi:uncharacterized protein YlxW (UPF0749 family)
VLTLLSISTAASVTLGRYFTKTDNALTFRQASEIFLPRTEHQESQNTLQACVKDLNSRIDSINTNIVEIKDQNKEINKQLMDLSIKVGRLEVLINKQNNSR